MWYDDTWPGFRMIEPQAPNRRLLALPEAAGDPCEESDDPSAAALYPF